MRRFLVWLLALYWLAVSAYPAGSASTVFLASSGPGWRQVPGSEVQVRLRQDTVGIRSQVLLEVRSKRYAAPRVIATTSAEMDCYAHEFKLLVTAKELRVTGPGGDPNVIYALSRDMLEWFAGNRVRVMEIFGTNVGRFQEVGGSSTAWLDVLLAVVLLALLVPDISRGRSREGVAAA